MSMVRIAFASDFGVAMVMKSFLESEGISVLDIARGGHVSIAGADQGYYIHVTVEDSERAVKLLKENSFETYLLK